MVGGVGGIPEVGRGRPGAGARERRGAGRGRLRRGLAAGPFVVFVLAGFTVGCASGGGPGVPPPAAEPPATANTPVAGGGGGGQGSGNGELFHSPGVPPESLTDPCAVFRTPSGEWLDRFRQWTSRVICATVLGFDGFFGDERAEQEKSLPSGLLGLRLRWSEREALLPRFRFRARFDLPNLDRRFKGFVGRETEDTYLKDSAEQGLAGSRAAEREYDWVLGLGFGTLKASQSRFTFGGGVRVSTSPGLFAKGRYRLYLRLGRDGLGRFRQTVFWRTREGFGTTTSLDLEQRFSRRFLLRWGSSGTLSESSRGVEWYSGLTLFQQFDVARAAYCRTWIKGATGAPVGTGEYGFSVVYRQRMFRDWFFGEVGTGITWFRDHPWERRKASVGVVVGAEMQFGRGSQY